MAILDRTGITPRDIAGYRAIFQERYRNAFGQDLAFDEETPQAQQIGIFALALAEVDEIVVADANGVSISKGIGFQLDESGELIGVMRRGATRSLVTVSLTGVAGTVIPARSRVRTAAGAEFRTRIAVTLTGAGDTVQMESEAFGPIPAPAGTLTQIVTVIAGWTAVTNAEAAALGRLRETDVNYRGRYQSFTARLAAGFPAAIRARILDVEGVIRAIVHDNDTDADVDEQGLTIPAHGILAIVQGGSDVDVAEAIRLSKTGAATGGSTTEGGISFERVSLVPVALTLASRIRSDFPADGINLIKAAIEEYAEANWEVGQTIDIRALNGPIYSVPGHVLTMDPAATIVMGGGMLPATPNLNVLYTLDADDITVTTTI